MGKLLERCYIHSTDIEYSQFYNKELTLRIDSLVNEKKIENEFYLDEDKLGIKIDEVFHKIEEKKNSYFMANFKELNESSLNRKSNLDFKEREYYLLKQELEHLKKKDEERKENEYLLTESLKNL